MKYARIEYKYLLPNELVNNVRNEILPFVELDRYCLQRPAQEYTVRSIYYDNRELKNYYEKESGLFGRKKIRIRGYNELEGNLNLFLEIKQKQGPAISKIRHSFVFNNRYFLLRERTTFEQLRFLESRTNTDALPAFINLIKRFNYIPIVAVVYEREAFFFRFDHDVRITFDKNLRSRLTNTPFHLFEENNLVPVMRKNVILEIKTQKSIPNWMRNIIARYELKRQALSKYTMSLDVNRINLRYFSFT